MPSMKSLISLLSADYPQFRVEIGKEFRWSADTQTIFVNANSPYAEEFVLHELSHAILGHKGYEKDIELIKYERDAWEYARTVLSEKYAIAITEEAAEDNLDTYRDWLHARSTCPSCQATGLQVKKRVYACVACGATWSVNEARLCGLKRYLHTKNR